MKQKIPYYLGIFEQLQERFRRIHQPHITSTKYWLSLIVGLVFFVIALVFNFYAGKYATDSMSNSVTDIILSHTRIYDVDGIFIYGSIILV